MTVLSVRVKPVAPARVAVGRRTMMRTSIFAVRKERHCVQLIKNVSVSQADTVQIVMVGTVYLVPHLKEEHYVRMMEKTNKHVSVYRKDIVQPVVGMFVKLVPHLKEGHYVRIMEIVSVYQKDIARLVMNTTVKLVPQRRG